MSGRSVPSRRPIQIGRNILAVMNNDYRDIHNVFKHSKKEINCRPFPIVYCAIFQWNSLLLRTIVNLRWFILTTLRNLYIKQNRTLTLQSLYRIFRCPRTVENFSTHSANGYYNTHIFHRVIHQFMIQTGDPLGKTHLTTVNHNLSENFTSLLQLDGIGDLTQWKGVHEQCDWQRHRHKLRIWLVEWEN